MRSNEQIARRTEQQVGAEGSTDAFRRWGADERLGGATKSADSGGAPSCLMLLEIDQFDRLGDNEETRMVVHTVLRAIAEFVAPIVGLNGSIATLGSNLIIQAGDTLLAGSQLAERIRNCIQESVLEVEGHRLRLTASLGVAQFKGGRSTNDLVTAARHALLQARRQGGNRVLMARW